MAESRASPHGAALLECVGRRLGRFQVGLISLFFALGAGVGAFLTLVQFRRAAYFIEQLGTQFGVHSYMPNAAMNYIAGTVMFLLIPAALFFMYQIRRNPTLGADQAHTGDAQRRR